MKETDILDALSNLTEEESVRIAEALFLGQTRLGCGLN